MTDELKLEELTREQILDLADAGGKKLGFLLATSPLDEGVKKSILGIIEKASLEQIGVITEFFEQGYLMAQNKDLNDWLKVQLKNIKNETDKKQEEVDKKTIAKIVKLEEKL